MTAVFTEPPPSYPDSPGPTTTVYTESLAHPERRPLSISLELPQSSPPFPSPSSSFLPSPVPGNHEFAMRPPPSGHATSKGTIVAGANGTANENGTLSGKDEEVKTPVAVEPERKLEAPSETSKDRSSTSFESPATAIPPAATTPSSQPPISKPTLMPALQQPAADSNTPTPLPATSVLPLSATPTVSSIAIPSSFQSPSMFTSQNNPLTPNRPAPPSPAASRRVSSMSTFSTRSPAPSTSTNVSRANSIRRSSRISVTSSARASAQFTATPAVAAAVVVQVQNSTPRVLIHVRDFAFDETDERFRGAGALVPRANHLAVLHKKLAGLPDDEDDETSENEVDGEDFNDVWDKLRGGWSLNGWGTYLNSPADEGPSQEEMNLNFGDAGEEYEDEEGEEPLYPGLYRAAYAFEPEGSAEMALVEDQVVRVVGRGGGVGWAVVVDESAGPNEDGEPRHALVPESYLEVVRLDWEDEEEAT